MRTHIFLLVVTTVVLLTAWNCVYAEEAPLVHQEPLPFVEGAFTIVVLPDTQGYAEDFPWIFEAQTGWIANNVKRRNIVFVLHLGDITDDNTPEQWKVAQRALRRLDGIVPYALALGNHDIGDRGKSATRDTLFNTYFPIEHYKTLSTFGGVFDAEPDRMDNSFHLFSASNRKNSRKNQPCAVDRDSKDHNSGLRSLDRFSAGGRDFLVLALEFGPRDVVVDWANRVLDRYPNRTAILITHAYLYVDDTRYDWKTYGKKQMWNPHSYRMGQKEGGCNDGEELWNKLVSKHPNMLMTLNGHCLLDGLGRKTSQGDAGNPVHQMLVNFQMKPRLGDGFLRLMEFLPDGETVQVKDYSPLLNAYRDSPDNHFTLKIPPPCPQKNSEQRKVVK